MKRWLLAIMTIATIAPFSAEAAETQLGNGAYARVSADVIFVQSADFTINGVSGEVSYDAAFGGQVAVGKKFHNFILEAEGGYANVGYDNLEVLGVSLGIDGNVDVFFGFMNGYVRMMKAPFEVYLGGGIGAAHQRAEVDSIGGSAVNLEEDETDFAANGTIAVNWFVDGSETGIAVGSRYRFYWINNGESGVDDSTAHAISATLTFPF